MRSKAFFVYTVVHYTCHIVTGRQVQLVVYFEVCTLELVFDDCLDCHNFRDDHDNATIMQPLIL